VIKNIGDDVRDETEMNYTLIEVEDAETVSNAILAMARDLKGESSF
jgi:hypothetical protein